MGASSIQVSISTTLGVQLDFIIKGSKFMHTSEDGGGDGVIIEEFSQGEKFSYPVDSYNIHGGIIQQ